MLFKGSKGRNSLAVIIFLISGCADSVFVPDPSLSSLVVSLPPPGFFTWESTIPVEISDISSTPDWTDFEARLLDQKGNELKFWKGQQNKQNKFSLNLPSKQLDVRDGDQLTLEVNIYKQETLEKTTTMDFFLVEKIPVLRVITNPTEVYPGSRSMLEILGDEPWLGQSWVKWSYNNKILSVGPWATHRVLRWNTPDKPGYFTPTAEVFPRYPSRGSYSFKSPLSVNVPVVTTILEPKSADQYGTNELSLDQSYLFLYHFRGNLRDSGVFGDPAEQPSWNKLDIDYRKHIFGVSFLPGGSLERVGNSFPLDGQGRLQPFSINIRGVLGKNTEGTIYNLEGSEGALSFSLTLKKALWVLSYTIGANSGVLESPARGIEEFSQTVSFMPSEDGSEILWFQGSQVVGSQILSWKTAPTFSSQGHLILGGANSFSGLLDEFGLYFKDENQRSSADAGVLEREMKARDSGRMLWAAGFDGSYLDNGFQSSPQFFRTKGNGVLNKDQWVETPLVEGELAGINLQLPSFEPGILRLELLETGKSPQSLLEIKGKNVAQSVLLSFTKDSEETNQFSASTKVRLLEPTGSFRLRLTNEKDEPVALDFIVGQKILKEDPDSLGGNAEVITPMKATVIANHN